jgi:hypothetical protein
MLVGLADFAGAALAGDYHGADAELVQRVLHGGLAVAAVGGDGAWTPPGPGDDPTDSGREVRTIGRVAALDGVVEHDAVVVVDNLSLVAELHRPAQAALRNWTGFPVVQRLTRRVAPSGVVPDSRWRVWSAIRRVAASSPVKSSTARRGRPWRRPATGSTPNALRRRTTGAALGRTRRSRRHSSPGHPARASETA